MLPVGFEPTIAAGERPKTYNLDGAATGTGSSCVVHIINLLWEPTCITLKLDICFSYRTETSVHNRKWLNNCWICVIGDVCLREVSVQKGVIRTVVCDGKILWKLAYGEFGMREIRISSSRPENRHKIAPAYEAARLTSYNYVRCVFWDYTRAVLCQI
jgi:hypothetical protein